MFFEKRIHIILPSNLFSDYMRDGNISHIIIINRTGNKPRRDHDVFNDDDDDDDDNNKGWIK